MHIFAAEKIENQTCFKLKILGLSPSPESLILGIQHLKFNT